MVSYKKRPARYLEQTSFFINYQSYMNLIRNPGCRLFTFNLAT